jgi:uncharacterized protein with PIN domain
MRLFRRNKTLEDEAERCPHCTERLPEGAKECAMCGVDLRPLLRSSSTTPQESHAASSG